MVGDVHLGQDFDARDKGAVDIHRERHRIVKRAVDAVTDAQAVFLRFDMNVGSASFPGFFQDKVQRLCQRSVDGSSDRQFIIGRLVADGNMGKLFLNFPRRLVIEINRRAQFIDIGGDGPDTFMALRGKCFDRENVRRGRPSPALRCCRILRLEWHCIDAP